MARRLVLPPFRPIRLFRPLVRGHRGPAHHYRAGGRQRRPGAGGIFSLRHQRGDPPQPGGGRYRLLLRADSDHRASQGKGRLLRCERGGELNLDRSAGDLSVAGRLDGGQGQRGRRSPDGRRLATEALRYENATNLIVTDKHFTFDGARSTWKETASARTLTSRMSSPIVPAALPVTACCCRDNEAGKRGSGEAGKPQRIGVGCCRYALRLRPPLPRCLDWLVLVLLWWAPLAYGQSDRCTFQITNVDRQGSVVETPQGTNYFAGGNVTGL